MTGTAFTGDPRIFINENGAFFEFKSGQPIMDSGLINSYFLSLFVKSKNHRGKAPAINAILPAASQVGSDFIDTVLEPVTVNTINDVIEAAENATQWMIDSGIILEQTITIVNSDNSYRQLIIEAKRPDGTTRQINFWLSLDGKPAGINL